MSRRGRRGFKRSSQGGAGIRERTGHDGDDDGAVCTLGTIHQWIAALVAGQRLLPQRRAQNDATDTSYIAENDADDHYTLTIACCSFQRHKNQRAAVAVPVVRPAPGVVGAWSHSLGSQYLPISCRQR